MDLLLTLQNLRFVAARIAIIFLCVCGLNLRVSLANDGIITEVLTETPREFLLPPVYRFDYNINPGIDVFLSPKILGFFEHNIDTVLELNGFSPSAYYSHEFTQQTGEKTLDQMISNPKTLSSIKKIRYYFRKFFQGIRIRNTHDFNLKVDGIDLSANWKNFGLEIHQDPEVKNKIIATVKIEADRLSLNLRSLKIEDLKHEFIEQVGGDQIFINLDQNNSPNLKVEIPIEIETFNGSVEQLVSPDPIRDGDLKFKVGNIETNIDELNLIAGWNAPLTMPSVSISINGRRATLRADRVEKEIKKQIPNLIKGLQESLYDHISENTPEVIESYLNDRFKSGYLDMISFEPFFAPDEEIERIINSGEFEDLYFPNAYVMGLKFKNISVQDDHLKISIGTFMEDGLSENNSRYRQFFQPKKEYPSEVYTNNELEHDVATVVNIDLINQFIKLSCKRGYFKKVDFGTGTPLKVSNCPYVYVNKNEKELRMVAEIEDRVQGFFKSKVVRNPIRVRFEAGVKIELAENGLYNLKLTKLYEKSLHINNKYIRFKMFRKAVKKAARAMLTDLNKDYANYTIYEGIPLPNTFGGISLKNLGAKYNKNGYIVLYMKMIL